PYGPDQQADRFVTVHTVSSTIVAFTTNVRAGRVQVGANTEMRRPLAGRVASMLVANAFDGARTRVEIAAGPHDSSAQDAAVVRRAGPPGSDVCSGACRRPARGYGAGRALGAAVSRPLGVGQRPGSGARRADGPGHRSLPRHAQRRLRHGR